MTKFSKVHYEDMAAFVKNLDCELGSEDIEIVANALCRMFREDNKRFSIELFIKACGIQYTPEYSILPRYWSNTGV